MQSLETIMGLNTFLFLWLIPSCMCFSGGVTAIEEGEWKWGLGFFVVAAIPLASLIALIVLAAFLILDKRSSSNHEKF